MEFTGQTFEKIQVEGCQAHICVQLLLGVNCPLTAYYYSSMHLLYESLLFSWGGEMRQHLRFIDFGAYWGQAALLFSKNNVIF